MTRATIGSVETRVYQTIRTCSLCGAEYAPDDDRAQSLACPHAPDDSVSPFGCEGVMRTRQVVVAREPGNALRRRLSVALHDKLLSSEHDWLSCDACWEAWIPAGSGRADGDWRPSFVAQLRSGLTYLEIQALWRAQRKVMHG